MEATLDLARKLLGHTRSEPAAGAAGEARAPTRGRASARSAAADASSVPPTQLTRLDRKLIDEYYPKADLEKHTAAAAKPRA